MKTTTYSNYLASKQERRLKKSEIRTLPPPLEGIDFASSDYLGFARSSTLKEALLKKLKKLPSIGAGGSRLLTGNSAYCEALEARIAHYHGGEAALLFHTGYLANLALFSAVCERDDTVLYDEQVHASIRDGILLSRARAHGFTHNDVDHLEHFLRKTTPPAFVAIESLYSTDGSLAPLEAISTLCERYGAHLIVDEAHATGVFGPGLVKCPVFAKVHTFSKALGVQGGAVVGSTALRSYLITTARPFIYTTALFYPQLAAIEAAYEKLASESHSLLSLCHQMGLQTPITTLPLPLLLPPEALGLKVSLLRYPTVARGKEAVRVCLHTFNTPQELALLHAWLDCHRN